MQLSAYNITAEVADHTYIHGGVGGEFHRVPTADWRQVLAFCEGTSDGSEIAATLEQLVRARVLISSETDELAVLRSRHWASRTGGPIGLTIVTSLGCNFDCPYCFEDKKPSLLKPRVADALVGLLDEGIAAGSPGLSVTWMGGEPLLGAKQLFELSNRFIARCDAAKIPYGAGILTNGWHLDAGMAKRLAAVRVRFAQVTIDGPADVHDRYRPTKSGLSSFDRIVDNVVAAIDHISVNIRVNIDRDNLGRAEELIAALAAKGLAGRVPLTPARLADIASAPDAPALHYGGGCFSCKDFGSVELEFDELADRYGFTTRGLPRAIGSPCTALRQTELVVGSDGELWKCWDDIGNPVEAIGTIFNYGEANENLGKWMTFDPFEDDQCRSCIALPGCMGGCAHHGFHATRDDQCGTFRHNHQQKVINEAHRWAGEAIPASGLVQTRLSRERSLATAVPVTLTAKRVLTPTA